MFERILAPIDPADCRGTKAVLKAAIDALHESRGHLRVLNVLTPFPSVGEYVPHEAAHPQRAWAEQEMPQILQGTRLTPDRRSGAIREGELLSEVLAEARIFGADLVVMGGRGESKWHHFLRCNAERVIRHARCPALVIPGDAGNGENLEWRRLRNCILNYILVRPWKGAQGWRRQMKAGT